jgi:nucleoside-diphosphate-sugar epimerase
VGSGKQTTLGEMVALAGEVFGIRAAPAWGGMANRAWDTTVWVSNIEKISRELDWRPRFSLEQGFRAMASWLAQLDDAGLDAYLGRTNAPSVRG